MMNSFSAEPIITVDVKNKKKPFVLQNNIEYISEKYNGKHYCIRIGRKYNWNGANIPRVFWRIVGSQYDPQFLPASCIHDWLTENKDFIKKRGAYTSSAIFRDILVLYGVPKFKANLMFSAVYAFQLTRKGWH